MEVSYERDWYCIAKQPAPAPHLADPEGRAAPRIALVTVHRVSRSCEHFPDGSDLHLLQCIRYAQCTTTVRMKKRLYQKYAPHHQRFPSNMINRNASRRGKHTTSQLFTKRKTLYYNGSQKKRRKNRSQPPKPALCLHLKQCIY